MPMNNWTEKRQHEREPVHLSGTAVTDDGLLRQEITVINVSRSGAMVEVPGSAELADGFTLLFKHSIEPCRVVWRDARFVGVQFERPAADNLNAAAPKVVSDIRQEH